MTLRLAVLAPVLLLSLATHALPVALFVLTFGLVLWVLGMLAINAFVSGVQFHLALQAIDWGGWEC